MIFERVVNLINEGEYLKVFIAAFAIIVLFLIILLLIEKVFLFLLSKVDDRKKYDGDKLLKKTIKLRGRKEKKAYHWETDGITKERYFATDYWVWQYNKLGILQSIFQIDKKIPYTNELAIRKSQQNKVNQKGKSRRYKKEFRVYLDKKQMN